MLSNFAFKFKLRRYTTEYNLTAVRLYTFGCPRVGNQPFADALRNTTLVDTRVTHDRDIVPSVPFQDMVGRCMLNLIATRVGSAWFQHLKLNDDELLSSLCFQFCRAPLRHGVSPHGARGVGAHHPRGAHAGQDLGRGLHSSTFSLNLSAFCGIRGACGVV